MERCVNCGRAIGDLETPYVFKETIQCAECYQRLPEELPTKGGGSAGPETEAGGLGSANADRKPLLTEAEATRIIAMSEVEHKHDIGEKTRAALDGDAEALNLIGIRFYCGEGLPRDARAASALFARAARWGSAPATDNLAKCYRDGHGVPEDKAAATKLFQRAAAMGCSSAMMNLGFAYLEGSGVPVDWACAADWLKKAAEAEAENYSRLWRLIGMLLEVGGNGLTPNNYSAALDCYRKGAALGDADCMFYIGLIYYGGRGVEENPGVSAAWTEKAAEAGCKLAMRLLGEFYRVGYGVPRSMKLSHYWHRMAIEDNPHGRPPAS